MEQREPLLRRPAGESRPRAVLHSASPEGEPNLARVVLAENPLRIRVHQTDLALTGAKPRSGARHLPVERWDPCRKSRRLSNVSVRRSPNR